MNDYVRWSAPVDALWDWKTEGIIYRKEQDPHATPGYILQAPDVCRGHDVRAKGPGFMPGPFFAAYR